MRREMRKITIKAMDEDIELRLQEEESGIGPVEELIEIHVDEDEPTMKLKISSELRKKQREEVIKFLRDSLEVFAWTLDYVLGINVKVMSHKLNVEEKYPPKRQKR